MQYVRGVGPRRAAEFERLGIRTVGDLLEHFPFRHEFKPRSVPIGDLTDESVATVVGELRNVRIHGARRDQVIHAVVVDGTGRCRVRWFHSAYLRDLVEPGRIVRLCGKVEVPDDLARFTNPETTFFDGEVDDPLADDHDRYEPVYPATAKLPSRQIHRIVDGILDSALSAIEDPLPHELRARRKLPPRRTAILRFHRPLSFDEVPIARRRLAYDELLLCQLAVQLSRRRTSASPKAGAIPVDERLDGRIRRRFPFALTRGQDQAVAEIRADLARAEPMNRLLQADVGAGKTAVAVYAALAAIARRRQVALLAPTEVLAAQHFAKVEQYLQGSRVRIAYLAGSTPKSKRAALLRTLRSGETDWLIGTHAVLEERVAFADLGLVIIDEQHKFGVAQRARARQKGVAPHVLVLTATPIPRTLAMTYFGDLDVSTIRDAPPGRQPVVTRLVSDNDTEKAWQFVRTRLSRGEQAFVVYPLVEESDSLPLKAATGEARRLAGGVLSGFHVGLLHGRMKPAEKEEVMRRFRSGAIHALVATTVIEVGVDVPNATIMAVQHAERYGLSQLHQLRGRIGRGEKKSYCLLFCEGGGEVALARLKIMTQTTDGFRIAEEDLRLRGPGELLGTRQHGLPTLKVADLVNDLDLITAARDDAAAILRGDPALSHPAHALLGREVARRYGQALNLVEVA